jgi:glutamate-ammonia-ligase adenylyltransferase
MRALIDKEKPPKDLWDFKLIPGGLVDQEFIAQFLTLVGPARNLAPHRIGESTQETLDRLGPSAMPSSEFEQVRQVTTLFTNLSQIVRLCIEGDFEPKQAPSGLIDLVCRAGDCPDIATLEGEVKRLSKAVRKTFQAVVRGTA